MMDMVEHQGDLHQKAESNVSGTLGITLHKAAITETKSVFNVTTKATLNIHVLPN